MTSKVCNKCGEDKPATDYYLHRGSRTSEGYRIPTCKECHGLHSRKWAKENPDRVKAHRRKRNLKTKYAISVEDYDAMLASQGGVCFICKSPPTRRRLSVDHHHGTGTVRKLLCDKCNMAIGLLEENTDRLDKVRKYLEDFAVRY
jgi:hypothetical protein